jgi:two-component system, cell cycle sensor histidine kinase and response regulator CckA
MVEALRENRELREKMAVQEREQQDRLAQQERLALVGQLAGGIAHDFNNLLSVILSYTSIINDELSDHDPVREDIGEIRKAGQRASALTRQLLAFSRRELAQPKPLDLGVVAADLDKLLRRLLGADIELVTRSETGLATVMMDPSQVEQVMVNLAVNARDAMPKGGRLEIAVSNAKGRTIVRLVVSDTGCGMTPEVQSRIFEPFFTTKPMGYGTGLGLATVHGIVHQAGGKIHVESELGRGTRFTIELPAVSELASRIHSSTPPEPGPARAERVLVCEDEAPLRAALDRILRSAGYQVTLACDGSEAIDELERVEYGYDLVLSDVVMPNVSGGALVERILTRRPNLPVLLVSGHAEDEFVRKGVATGGVPFLAKPFTAEVLLAKVAELLSEARSLGAPKASAS